MENQISPALIDALATAVAEKIGLKQELAPVKAMLDTMQAQIKKAAQLSEDNKAAIQDNKKAIKRIEDRQDSLSGEMRMTQEMSLHTLKQLQRRDNQDKRVWVLDEQRAGALKNKTNPDEFAAAALAGPLAKCSNAVSTVQHLGNSKDGLLMLVTYNDARSASHMQASTSSMSGVSVRPALTRVEKDENLIIRALNEAVSQAGQQHIQFAFIKGRAMVRNTRSGETAPYSILQHVRDPRQIGMGRPRGASLEMKQMLPAVVVGLAKAALNMEVSGWAKGDAPKRGKEDTRSGYTPAPKSGRKEEDSEDEIMANE